MTAGSQYGPTPADNNNPDDFPVGIAPSAIGGEIREALAAIRQLKDRAVGKIGSGSGQTRATTNLHTEDDSGLYTYAAGATGAPNSAAGVLQLYRSDNLRLQIAYTANERVFVRFVASDSNFGDANTWQELGIGQERRTTEEIEDIVGAMFAGNTETNITATYDDGSGKINLTVPSMGGQALTKYNVFTSFGEIALYCV